MPHASCLMSVETGLCGTCRMARRIVTARGSTFLYCTRADSDPAYPKYPRLPVLHCAGYLDRLLPLETQDPSLPVEGTGEGAGGT
jgi:hypothetical protein